MKTLRKISLIAALAIALISPSFAVNARAAEITTAATGYTKASDVNYVKQSGYVVNWGARGEDCGFLSEYAEDFYTGSYQYDTMSLKSGGTAQSNAYNSALYKALQSMMKAEHSKETSYSATKSLYCYTDCVSNNYKNISSFYSGKTLSGEWDGGSTWNREHTWPNSKGFGGNDENDIMMLRPTSVQENSSRGNTAYGKSSGYYDPGVSVRGDCARIFLYVYVRWGNTSYAWGKSGVMESMSVLLDWMEEDPVDTWEMGRNDAVESITGTRNVFVDYPEYAWLLFGKDIPDDMRTPSGIANEQSGGSSNRSSESSSDSSYESSPDVDIDSSEYSSEEESSSETSSDSSEAGCSHEYSDWYVKKEPTETEYGERIRTCIRCGDTITELIAKTSGGDVNCAHEYSDWYVVKEPTRTEEGREVKTCIRCGDTCVTILPRLETSGSDEDDSSSVGDGDSAAEGCNASMSGTVLAITLLGACAIVMKKREN